MLKFCKSSKAIDTSQTPFNYLEKSKITILSFLYPQTNVVTSPTNQFQLLISFQHLLYTHMLVYSGDFTLLVYHLNCGKLTWSPTSNEVKNSMVFVRTLVQEKTGLKIDQPDPKGGTTSTGGVPRRTFSSESKFIDCVSSCVAIGYKETLSQLHTRLSAILRIINSDRKINTEEFGDLCTNTYILILESLPGQALHRHCIGY